MLDQRGRAQSLVAGARGLQILLAPADYVRVTGARLGPIAAAE
jgi:prolyl-tRNA editing enzyme YbaK/EbsC (Cys-tRNA(Pro) deacylase)